MPTSCTGKKPLGTTTYKAMLAAMVAKKTTIMVRVCASAQSSERA